MIDRGRAERTCGLRGEIHHAAVGANGAALFDERIQRTVIDADLDRSAEIEGHGVARTHQHVAAVRVDLTAVRDMRGNQRYGATLAGGDSTLLGDALVAASS